MTPEPVTGGVCAPAGFSASGVACGIKANGAPDLAIVACDHTAPAAAVFTTNRAVAAPVIVSRAGKLVLVTGSPGGRTIINTSLDVVLGVTAWGLTGRQAVDAPRMHHQWLPDRLSIEDAGVPQATVDALTALGHDVRMGGRQGSAQSIWVHPNTGMVYGVADMRSPDAKASRKE